MSRDSGDDRDNSSDGWWLLRKRDVVALMLILAIIALFCFPLIQYVRDAAIRLQCVNNLKQIGLAIHNYHNSFNAFPNPDVTPFDEQGAGIGQRSPSPHTIYADLLPFLVNEPFDKDWEAHPPPVKIYVCPARRWFTDGKAPTAVQAPDDYAIGIHPDWFGPQTTAPFGGPPNGYPPATAAKGPGSVAGTTRWFSILGGQWVRTPQGDGTEAPIFPGTNLGQVTDEDGASNTLLMAHKGMAPSQYGGGSPTDLGWNVVKPVSTALAFEHMRCPFGAVRDFDGNHNGTGAGVPFCDESIGTNPQSANSMDWLLGSPHTGSMPCVFADGSVRGIVYGAPIDPPAGARPGAMAPHLWAKLWAFNDSTQINDVSGTVEPAR